jgi:hypothetical protein
VVKLPIIAFGQMKSVVILIRSNVNYVDFLVNKCHVISIRILRKPNINALGNLFRNLLFYMSEVIDSVPCKKKFFEMAGNEILILSSDLEFG